MLGKISLFSVVNWLLLGSMGCFPNTPVKVKEWFDEAASGCNTEESLHACSRWGYLSKHEFKLMVMLGVDAMDPPLKDGESIFDMGVGVGAPFKVLLESKPNLRVGGSDLATNAIKVARRLFPEQRNNFFVHDMTTKLGDVPDNSWDHVVSFGALAMYLSREQMQQAFKEAVRMTKPGGSMLFTHFIEPEGSGVGSIITLMTKDDVRNMLTSLNVEDIKIISMSSIRGQGDRYLVTGRKK